MSLLTVFRFWCALWMFVPAAITYSESGQTGVSSNEPASVLTNEAVFGEFNTRLGLKESETEPPVPDGVTVRHEPRGVKSMPLEKIARVSIPVFFEEKNEAYTLRDRSHDNGVKTMKLSSGYVTAFKRYIGGDDHSTNEFVLPVLQMSIDYDEVSGDYEVNRLGIGFFNERLWLMHEMGDIDEEDNRYGIQLKRKW